MYARYFVPFPTLTTARLRIRQMSKADTSAIYDICRRPESARYVEWTEHQNIGETRAYVNWIVDGYGKQRSTTWVIELLPEKKVIGTCCFLNIDSYYKTAEIGYCLSSAYWGRGYATEAVWALLWYGFREIGFARIQARVMTENFRSAAVLERIGFEKEGLLKNAVYCKNQAHNIYLYAMTDGMYRKTYGKMR